MLHWYEGRYNLGWIAFFFSSYFKEMKRHLKHSCEPRWACDLWRYWFCDKVYRNVWCSEVNAGHLLDLENLSQLELASIHYKTPSRFTGDRRHFTRATGQFSVPLFLLRGAHITNQSLSRNMLLSRRWTEMCVWAFSLKLGFSCHSISQASTGTMKLGR
jgi:hypothetical protein